MQLFIRFEGGNTERSVSILRVELISYARKMEERGGEREGGREQWRCIIDGVVVIAHLGGSLVMLLKWCIRSEPAVLRASKDAIFSRRCFDLLPCFIVGALSLSSRCFLIIILSSTFPQSFPVLPLTANKFHLLTPPQMLIEQDCRSNEYPSRRFFCSRGSVYLGYSACMIFSGSILRRLNKPIVDGIVLWTNSLKSHTTWLLCFQKYSRPSSEGCPLTAIVIQVRWVLLENLNLLCIP